MVQDQGPVCSAAATREYSVQQPPVPSPWIQPLPWWGLFCFPQLSVPLPYLGSQTGLGRAQPLGILEHQQV